MSVSNGRVAAFQPSTHARTRSAGGSRGALCRPAAIWRYNDRFRRKLTFMGLRRNGTNWSARAPQ